jgi:acetyl-CoA C-acetyltransferase
MGKSAIAKAIADARLDPSAVTALYVGNMLSGMLSDQQHVGPVLATAAGLSGVETSTVEACCGSGGAALRWGYMAVASGMHETVIVAGVEQMTHREGALVTKGLATASDWEKEGSHGATFVSLNGTLMSMYKSKYGINHEAFGAFPTTAHNNASTSAHATLKKRLASADYEKSPVITDPVRLLDACPTCDGAAAVVLTSNRDMARRSDSSAVVRLAGSGAASDILCVMDRPEPLHLAAVQKSTQQALAHAQVEISAVDMFELHDAYSIMACLCLESAGFVLPGEGTQFANDGHLALNGILPFATFGGLKARGHPVGATGVYQAAEVMQQLTGLAGENQVKGAEVALAQNIGGAGASVYTHVFVRE